MEYVSYLFKVLRITCFYNMIHIKHIDLCKSYAEFIYYLNKILTTYSTNALLLPGYFCFANMCTEVTIC